MKNTFIFDIDGTLIDTEVAVLESLQLVLQKHFGLEKTLADLEFSLGIPAAIIMQKLGVDPELGVKYWHEEIPPFWSSMHPYAEMTETIKSLKDAGESIAIVTSKTDIEFKNEVSRFELMDYFDLIVTSSMTTKHKPNPEPVLKALELLQADPTTSIYFGDTAYDMESAHAAKIDFGLAGWGAHDHGQFTAADYRFKNPSAILSTFSV